MKTWEVLLVTFLIVQAIEARRKKKYKDSCPKEVLCGGRRCRNDNNCPFGQLCCKADCRGKRCSCPKGKPLFFCLVAPCSVTTCPRVPKAECRNDYCGGCFARFFLGDKEVTKRCRIKPRPPPPPAPSNCPAPANPGICAFTCQPGSCLGLEICCLTACGGSSCVCPVDVPVASCSDLPCDIVDCPKIPGAECRNSFCGGCVAIFVNVTDGGQEVEITDKCYIGDNDRSRGTCPDTVSDSDPCTSECIDNRDCIGRTICCDTPCGGSRCVCRAEELFQPGCSPDLCDLATCPMIPEAQCEIQACFLCSSVFFIGEGTNKTDVTSQCHPRTGDGSLGGTCPVPENVGATCNAMCTDSFCIGDQLCCPTLCSGGTQCVCPANVPVPACWDEPCDVAVCPNAPNAQCENQYCGICKAVFFVEASDGSRSGLENWECMDVSTLDASQCPDDVQDDPNTCHIQCDANSCLGDYVCCTTPCGGTKCVCPRLEPGELRPPCPEPPCERPEAACTVFLGARCFNDWCNCDFINYVGTGLNKVDITEGCQPVFIPAALTAGGQCPPLSPVPASEDCSRNCENNRDCDPGRTCCDSLCPSNQCSCPPGTPQVACVQDPCNVATCPGVPRARCFGNICGECRARFFRGRREVTDQCNP